VTSSARRHFPTEAHNPPLIPTLPIIHIRPKGDDQAVASVEIGNHSDDRAAPRLDDISASWLNLDGGSDQPPPLILISLRPAGTRQWVFWCDDWAVEAGLEPQLKRAPYHHRGRGAAGRMGCPTHQRRSSIMSADRSTRNQTGFDFSAAEAALRSVAAAFEKYDGADHASSPFADKGPYFLI